MALIKADDFSSANDTFELNQITGWIKHATYNKRLYIYGAYSAATVIAYGSDQGFYYRSETPDSADQSVACDFIFGDYGVDAEKSGWICARVDTASATMYRGGHVEGEWRIEKVVSGTVTVLASVSDVRRNQTVNCRLEVIGSTLNLYGAGASTPTLTATDNSITAAGKVGIGVQGDVLLRIDNFTASTLSGSNAAPAFTGPNIGNQTGTVGAALTSNNIASKFSDTDTLTFSAIGSWPPGVTVSSAGVISGTPTAAGTYSSLKVRATDTAAQTVDSDTFSFTINSAAHLITAANSQQVNTASSAAVLQSGNGTITLPALKDWGTGNLKANESGVTIIINNASTGALVNLLTGQSANASGVLPALTGLVSGTAYRVTTILSDGSEGTWKYTAS